MIASEGMLRFGELRNIPNLEPIHTYYIDGIEYRQQPRGPFFTYRSRYDEIRDPLDSREFDRCPVGGIAPCGDGLAVELVQSYYDAALRRRVHVGEEKNRGD